MNFRLREKLNKNMKKECGLLEGTIPGLSAHFRVGIISIKEKKDRKCVAILKNKKKLFRKLSRGNYIHC